MLDKIKGCLIGGAVGDALGYPVEFLEDYRIFEKYGERGITELNLYKQHGKDLAIVSDDTQMTLFTADGLLHAFNCIKRPTIESCINSTYHSYLSWLLTQESDFALPKNIFRSKLLLYKELNACRAPGNTCLSALRSGVCGTIDNPINDSKGCGGIMRVAPVGLIFSNYPNMTMSEIGEIGASIAAITHGHKLGYIPAAWFSMIIAYLMRGETLLNSINYSKTELIKIFHKSEEINYLIKLIDRAIELATAAEPNDVLDDIRELGEGWVAEETLAIAIYCSLRFKNDFEKAVIAAVNHSGDSDSTGAVTGNILGVTLGFSNIPHKFIKNLDVLKILEDISKEIDNECCYNKFKTTLIRYRNPKGFRIKFWFYSPEEIEKRKKEEQEKRKQQKWKTGKKQKILFRNIRKSRKKV